MQEVLMSMSLGQPRSIQLELFANPQPGADWRELPPEVQQKTLQLLTLLLRQHGTRLGAVQSAEEARDE
jgi:hypothetical protein